MLKRVFELPLLNTNDFTYTPNQAPGKRRSSVAEVPRPKSAPLPPAAAHNRPIRAQSLSWDNRKIKQTASFLTPTDKKHRQIMKELGFMGTEKWRKKFASIGVKEFTEIFTAAYECKDMQVLNEIYNYPSFQEMPEQTFYDIGHAIVNDYSMAQKANQFLLDIGNDPRFSQMRIVDMWSLVSKAAEKNDLPFLKLLLPKYLFPIPLLQDLKMTRIVSKDVSKLLEKAIDAARAAERVESILYSRCKTKNYLEQQFAAVRACNLVLKEEPSNSCSIQ